MEKLLEAIKIRNYIHAIFYPSVILLLGSLFYGKTYAFTNEQIAKFAILWIAVSLIEFFFNDMLSLFQIYSLRAQQEGKKIFVDKLWWAIIVILIHIAILGTGLWISFWLIFHMPAFDVQGAKQAGYSDQEIRDFLQKNPQVKPSEPLSN